jgi:hypothetical protein
MQSVRSYVHANDDTHVSLDSFLAYVKIYMYTCMYPVNQCLGLGLGCQQHGHETIFSSISLTNLVMAIQHALYILSVGYT